MRGNQKNIGEMIKLLDPTFIPDFICKCAEGGGIHLLTCPQNDNLFSIYEIEYQNGKIEQMRLLHKYSENLLDGCVR